MKNYTITVNGNVYNVTVEEGTTAGVVQNATPVAAPAAAVAAPKAPAKKAAPAKATAPKAVKLFVEYQGGQVSTQDIAAKAAEASGKKAIKELNVYYQPETNMVYYTADGTEGSFSL